MIGGAPAAAVVFTREVNHRTGADPRIVELDDQIERAAGSERQHLRAERDALWAEVRSEKLGEFAGEFDSIHSIERAVEVGSVERIVAPAQLRPYLIDAVERGMQRTLARLAGSAVNGGAANRDGADRDGRQSRWASARSSASSSSGSRVTSGSATGSA